MLGKIKDGRILASKYDSKELKFKTPNIVVVFSNDKPDVKQLALDRWKIFSIINEGLVEDLIPNGKMSTSDFATNGYHWKPFEAKWYLGIIHINPIKGVKKKTVDHYLLTCEHLEETVGIGYI